MWPVKWEKSVNDSQNGNYQVKKSVIKFESLSEQDFGTYKCTSSNLFGITEISLNINRNEVFVSSQTHKQLLKFRKKVKSGFGKKLERQEQLNGMELRKRRFRFRNKFAKTN
jgi:hypothetical protein